MDERLRFIARLLEGEKMAPLCREFGISRVTGHKLFNRFPGMVAREGIEPHSLPSSGSSAVLCLLLMKKPPGDRRARCR
jgi:hypothetical protein